jgi:hypothetical protein
LASGRRTRWRQALTRVATAGAGGAGGRIATRVAAGGGLLAIGLAVAAVPWWPAADAGDDLSERFSGVLSMTVGVPFAVLGALLCARRPGNRIGWLLLVGGLSATVLEFAGDYVQRGGPGLRRRERRPHLHCGFGRASAQS